jgi:hypothetical protein
VTAAVALALASSVAPLTGSPNAREIQYLKSFFSTPIFIFQPVGNGYLPVRINLSEDTPCMYLF